MSENYKPGTVAEATVCDIPGVRVFRRHNETGGDWAFNPEPERGIYYSCAGDREGLVTDVRPLVVLDLPAERASLIRDLMECARSGGVQVGLGTDLDELADLLIEQIEAQTSSPKPAEPKGIGAVVVDEDGDAWVHDRDAKPGYLGVEWLNVRTQAHRHYESIAAVRVLSEGVEVDR